MLPLNSLVHFLDVFLDADQEGFKGLAIHKRFRRELNIEMTLRAQQNVPLRRVE